MYQTITMTSKTGNLADEELRENELIMNLNKANETLPTMEQLHAINKNKAGLILTEIQNGILTKVKTEQINLKKTVQNELTRLLYEPKQDQFKTLQIRTFRFIPYLIHLKVDILLQV